MSHTLKFMTFNIRVAAGCDGINMFFNRAHRVVEVIEKEQPDVIGFQEVTDEMRAWLRDRIPGYTVQGCGRERDYHGESMLLAYKTDAVEMISLDNLWLSPTPRVPGSRFPGDQSSCPRMLTTVLLKHNDVKEPFRFINTHLDHVGAQARYLGSMELCRLISSYPEKFVLTGDFNATPETPEIKVITEALADRGVTDCTAGLPGTFHGFGHYPDHTGPKIDYVFSDFRCTGSYIVEDVPVDGMYYSDHNAVVAVIETED